MSEQNHEPGRERHSMRNVLIVGAAAGVAVAAVAGTQELAEMPDDAYSSMEGVQVAVPSNVFEQIARKITGKPNYTVTPGNLTEVIAKTAIFREYELDQEAAVSYAIKNNPELEPYRLTDLPAGELFQVPLPNPEIEFVGPSQYPFMMRTQPDNLGLTNPDGSIDIPLQDATYEANKYTFVESGLTFPVFGSFKVGAHDISKWTEKTPSLSDAQKNTTIQQAVSLITPPTPVTP